MWKIEKIVSKGAYNYAVVRDHPNAIKYGYVLHHRIVVENHLKRLLKRNEVVHHINGKKKDNRLKNLKVEDAITHGRLHGIEQGRLWVSLRCPWCACTFQRPRNTTHLQKPSNLKVTCCGPSCRGNFSRYVQLHGKTLRLKLAVDANVQKIYRIYQKL